MGGREGGMKRGGDEGGKGGKVYAGVSLGFRSSLKGGSAPPPKTFFGVRSSEIGNLGK